MPKLIAKIQNADMAELMAGMGATSQQARASMRRALARVSKWARGEAVMVIQQATNLPFHVVRRRLQFKTDSLLSSIWIGLSPVPLDKMNPVQDASGVTAGPARVPGAFIVKGGGPSKGKAVDLVMKRRSTNRLKVDRVFYEVYDIAQPAIERLYQEIETRLGREFERELKWETTRRR